VETTRRALVALPEASALVVLALAVPVSLLVTVGAFRPWLALAATVPVLGLLWWLAPPRASSTTPLVLPTLLAVAGALVWTVVNVRYAGENIGVDRDAAVYALAGHWLIDHPTVNVPTDGAASVAAGIDHASTAGLGFGRTMTSLSPEFVHTTSGIVAVAGWAGGTSALLAANVVIGGVALLALFALARAVVGDWWALLPPLAVGLAMPMANFARSTYSEPLSLVMIAMGSALLLTLLAGTSATPHRTALMAGTFLGAVGIARVDGALVAASAMVGLALWFVLQPASRREGRQVVVRVALPAAGLLALGIADMARNSGNYLVRLSGEVGALVSAFALAAVLAWVAVVTGPRVHAWLRPRQRRVATGAAVGVAVVSAVLLSRPWWMLARSYADNEILVRDIERHQARAGVPIDGTRSYDELSLEWVSWYQGWPAVLLGLAGLAVLAYRAVSGRRPGLVALLPLAALALLYLVRPSITPDQVWAMRRLLTGAVPLLLIAATALLALLARRGRAGTGVAVVAALAVGLWPLSTWSGMFDVRDRVGQVPELEAACDSIDADLVVLANGAPGVDYLPPLRIVCDVQVVRLNPATQQSLAAIRDAWGGEPVSLITFDEDGLPWTRQPDEPVHRARIEMWERSVVGAPSVPTVWRRAMWAGTVLPDGRVEPRPPSSEATD